MSQAGPRSAVGRAPDSQVRGPGFDTRSGHILSFLLPLIQEGQLSVTGESMCTKYWLSGDMGASMIRDLVAAINCDGKVPSDWEQSFIVCLYKGKGDALERGNYRGLKLTEQVMKVLERIVDGLIRQVVSIDDSQFGFVPGRGTTDAIFVVRQLQEKYLAANKRLYMAFVDLEKALT